MPPPPRSRHALGIPAGIQAANTLIPKGIPNNSTLLNSGKPKGFREISVSKDLAKSKHPLGMLTLQIFPWENTHRTHQESQGILMRGIPLGI